MSPLFKKRLFKTLFFFLVFVLTLISLKFCYKIYLKTAYPIKYQEYVDKSSSIYNVDPALVYAVIRTESKFNESARSHAGAVGLMQIMPSTFEWISSKKKESLTDKDLEAPDVNIDYGTYLLSFLFSKYQDFDTSIAAYNAGMGTVDKWLKDKNVSADSQVLDKIPYGETQIYIKRVKESYRIYKELYFKNI